MKQTLFETHLWKEFETFCSEVAGLPIQVFDEEGCSVTADPRNCGVCHFLKRHPKTAAACRRDCGERIRSLAAAGKEMSLHCYAGLDYRVFPFIREGGRRYLMVIGRVLTSVSDSGFSTKFADSWRLDPLEYGLFFSCTPRFSEKKLDRASAMMKKLGLLLEVLRERSSFDRSVLYRYSQSLSLLGSLVSSPPDPARLDAWLDQLKTTFDLEAAALVPARGISPPIPRIAASGLDGKALETLSKLDPGELPPQQPSGATLETVLTKSDACAGDLPFPVSFRRLGPGNRPMAFLFLFGSPPGTMERRMLDILAQALSDRLAEMGEAREARRQRPERTLLEKIDHVSAGGGELADLLERSLEAVMEVTGARRGSLFVINEDDGRVIAEAMRGPHAELSGHIPRIVSGSITDQVRAGGAPLVVDRFEQHSAPRRRRRFPYRSDSFISFPLRDDGHVLGVMNLAEPVEEDDFLSWDPAALDHAGRHLSSAIRRLTLEARVNDLLLSTVTDPVTSVYNRRFLEVALGREVNRAVRFQHPLSVIRLDIDDFGGPGGPTDQASSDAILADLASTFLATIRGIDFTVRWEGTEFLIVLPETGTKGAISIAEKIRAAVEARRFPLKGGGPVFTLTVSMGVCCLPDSALTAEDLLSKAGEALVRARKIGRNIVLPWTG